MQKWNHAWAALPRVRDGDRRQESVCAVSARVGADAKFPHAGANRKLTIEVDVNL